MATTKEQKSFKTAAEYLADWAASRSQNWLKVLTLGLVAQKKAPDADFIDYVYNLFLFENKLAPKKPADLEVALQKGIEKDNQEIKDFQICSIEHISGVNALKPKAKLNFHPKLTVIFGRNGSGKSGYARILKRASNTPPQEDIWTNIHKEKEKNKCEAIIEVKINGAVKPIDWKGVLGESPFTELKIFDGKSVPIYLKEELGFSYKPYGIELFNELADSVRTIGIKLRDAIEEKNVAINFVDPTAWFNEGTSTFEFVEAINADTTEAEIVGASQWGKKEEEELVKLAKEQKELMTIEHRLETISRDRSMLATFIENTESFADAFSPEVKKVCDQKVKAYLKKKEEVGKREKISLAGHGLKGMDSDEWRDFIESAESYITAVHGDHYPNSTSKCIYCNQKLSATALELVKKYRALMMSEESDELGELEEDMERFSDQLNEKLEFSFFKHQKAELERICGKDVVSAYNAFFTQIWANGEHLVSSIGKNKYVGGNYRAVLLKPLLERIEPVLEKLNKMEDGLVRSNKYLAKSLGTVQDKIDDLKDRNKLAQKKKEVINYLHGLQWVHKANACLEDQSISTTPITNLEKKAWKDLVSESFENSFGGYIKEFSAPAVDLAFPATYGAQKREKRIEGMRNIDAILSEGEQRAVAMSDFLAENTVDGKNSPLVFDDPANSFDEGRRRILAKKIVEESKKRQVIVFTHDVDFSSYIFDNVIKEGDVDAGAAAFHWLDSDDNGVGVVKENDYPRMKLFVAKLKRAELMIGEAEKLTGSDREDKVESIYSELREAVECAVVEKLFGGVVRRWDERLQMQNLPKVKVDMAKYTKAKELHDEFSGYMKGHSHSDERRQDFPKIDKVKEDFKNVSELIA